MRPSVHAIAAAAALFFAAPTDAALLDFNGSEVTGATGVIVDGVSYDVSFVDGTCADLFNGCDSSADFTFTDKASAEAAAQAIIDQIFSSFFLAFQPSNMTGCEDLFECFVIIPYNSGVDVAAAVNETGAAFDFIAFGTGASANLDTSSDPDEVLALFTRSDASAVPDSATWAMMLLGFATVGFAMRKRRAHALAQLT